MNDPDNNGYKSVQPLFSFHGCSERTLEMLKTLFCIVLATWVTSALMVIVYSREIATFMVERMQ